jgi:hypothetical protein
VTQRFTDVTAVRPLGDGHFAADVDTKWTIGGKPNGGYLLAMLGRAAGTMTEHPHVIAASAHYLRSPDPGPVEISVGVLHAGRSTSQLRATMQQREKPCVEALLAVSTLKPDATPHWDAGVPALTTAAYDDGKLLTGRSPSGLAVALMEQVAIRIEPATAGFLRGAPDGRGELRGWLELPGTEPFDPLSLLFAVDAFPPATFNVELAGWVPTLELSAYVRALPAPGPVRILQRAQLIDGRRVDEACFVWDSTGRLVAQATQLAGIRLG